MKRQQNNDSFNETSLSQVNKITSKPFLKERPTTSHPSKNTDLINPVPLN